MKNTVTGNRIRVKHIKASNAFNANMCVGAISNYMEPLK